MEGIHLSYVSASLTKQSLGLPDLKHNFLSRKFQRQTFLGETLAISEREEPFICKVKK